MKRFFSFILCIISIALCGCENTSNNSDFTMPTFEATQAQTTAPTTTDAVIQNTSKSYADWGAGGWDYTRYGHESETVIYNGNPVVRQISISSDTAYECCMGAYLFAEGIPIPFTMEEFSDDSFSEAISEVSESSVFHQLTFPASDGYVSSTKYYEITYKLDMFEKGAEVLPTLTCTVNNDYYPSAMNSIIPQASSAFGLYPPKINIATNKMECCEVCEEYTTEAMPKDYYDVNDNGYPKFEISQVTNNEDTVSLQLRGHTVNDGLKYIDKTVYITLLINDEIYPSFDGKTTLKLTINSGTYYTYDVLIDKNDLRTINRVQIIGFVIDHENGNTLIMPSADYFAGD